MIRTSVIVSLLVLSFLAAAGLRAASPVEPLPPLRVSANGHFFVDAQDRPVFVLADTAWGLFSRLRREEITAYLEHRRAQGFNAVAAVLYAPRNSDINKSATNAYGRDPFARTGGEPDPTKPLVTPGTDPAKGDAYDFWDHVDFAFAEMRRLGFYGFILPCWGNEVASVISGDAPNPKAPARGALAEPKTAQAYGRWLGERYAGARHVQWMLGGDRSAVDARSGADFRAAFRAMAAGLQAAAPQALLSYHPQKAGLQSGDWFHEDAWLGFNSVQLWPEEQVRVITRDWQAKPVKPTWIFEGRYEGYWKRGYQPGDWGEWQIRQQAWSTVLAGAFGHTYGHERVFGFGTDGANWRDHLDAPGARSMTHLARFMRSLPPAAALHRLPDQALLASGEGRADRLKSDRILVSRTPDGTCAIVYAANGRTVHLRMAQLAPGSLPAAWFNPRNGLWHAAGAETPVRVPFAPAVASGPGAADHAFDPPGEPGDGNDWVLVLAAK